MFIRRIHKIAKENAISELVKVRIGQIDQWIYIRGEDQNKPILLIIHGGPGAAQIGFARKFQEELERYFVVVNWDQRGSGLSYAKDIPDETMTIDQFVQDTIELTDYLRDQFGQEKIYLLGHSWGTIIGLLAVHRKPHLYKRYFGVAQVVNYLEAEKLSYKMILEKARQESDKKAIKQLSVIGVPPWPHLKHDRVHQKYLETFGGGISRDGKLVSKILKVMLTSGEYTLLDIIKHFKGQHYSLMKLQDEMRRLNLKNVIRSVKVPVYFCMGRHDLTVPSQPTRKFYDALQAEEKHWIWFEHSAHSPMFEEKSKFLELIIRETQCNNERIEGDG